MKNLSIAYEMKRRNKKKDGKKSLDSSDMFAEGGSVKEQSRPMPSLTVNDAKSVAHNSGNKAPGEDSWGDNTTVKQAQKPSITRLSQPKIVGSDAFSVRNMNQRDENNDQIDSFYPESDKAQPKEHYNEYGANRQGPKVPDMEQQHKAKRAAYQQASENQYSEDVADGNMKKVQSPLGRYAKGGEVEGAKTSTGGAKTGGAKTSTTGNKTKTGGSNPGGASTGGAGTVTITTRDLGSKGINVSNVGGKTDSKNHGGMDPGDEDDDGKTMMARGGPVMQPSDYGQELEERTDELDMLNNLYPGAHGEQPASWRDELYADRQNQNPLDMEMQHNSGRKAYAKGGHIQFDDAESIDAIDHDAPNSSYDKHDSSSRIDRDMMSQPQPEADEERHASIAAAIMSKKAQQMKLQSDSDIDDMVMMAQGGPVYDKEGQADLNLNSMEQPNKYYPRNREILKENYDSDMKGVDQPEDSNEHGDAGLIKDARNMISKIRSKMAIKRGMK